MSAALACHRYSADVWNSARSISPAQAACGGPARSGVEDRPVSHLLRKAPSDFTRLLVVVVDNMARSDVGSVKVVPHVLGCIAVREAVALTDADTLQAQLQGWE